MADLGFSGPQFTCSRRASSDSFVGARLDREMCNLEWRMLCPDATISYLPRAHSNHCPILLLRVRIQRAEERLIDFIFNRHGFSTVSLINGLWTIGARRRCL